MNIFLVLSGVPNEKGEAIEVVGYEVVRLMAQAGHRLNVQVLIREGRTDDMENKVVLAKQQFAKVANIELLPVMYIGDLKPPKGKFRRLVDFGFAALRSLPIINTYINSYFFPAMSAKNGMRRVVKNVSPDIILSIWSWEALAATYDIKGIPKFVYYGNPNHKPPEAHMQFPGLFDMPLGGIRNRIRMSLFKMFNRAREIQHLKMMDCCEVTANNSLVDADYYREQGHPRSIYLQNMWPEDPKGPVFGGRGGAEVLRLAGSVGNLGATGNTFGLYYLGDKLAPVLEKRLPKERLKIDVYGGGKARKKVAKSLRRDSIELRGWVDDLVKELNESHAFLVLTNVDGFIVGNTRILLAWSLGSCVVAHRNSALSMPEIEHMNNALLADTEDEMADLIMKLFEDDELRTRIGLGGYETFQKYYRSDVVVPKMLDAMQSCIKEFKEGAH